MASRKISAGELRNMGVVLDLKIPDCATTTLGDIKVGDMKQEGDTLAGSIILLPATAFKWVECEMILTKNKA